MSSELKVWRLHPKSMRLEKAEKTLNGTANEAGTKWCRPYSSVNALGWWIYPAVDLDVCWKDGKLEHQLLEPWHHVEHDLIKSLAPNMDIEKFCPPTGRSKFTWGVVEENVAQFWTGIIFQTPPGWCLQVRSPINSPQVGYHVMEGVLETDWMYYDIWINVVFDVKDQVIQFRKDQWPPLAQIMPIRRESVDAPWKISGDEVVNRNTPEANHILDYWLQYNQKKFGEGGKQYLGVDRTKDATTFFRERQAILDKETFEPIPEKIEPKPLKAKKKIKNKFIGVKNDNSRSSEQGIPKPSACPFSGTHSGELGKNSTSHDCEHGIDGERPPGTDGIST